MDLGASSLALSFAAGLASVASPCVLPVVPLLVAGTTEEHRARPALVVAGLAASFVAMGVATSLFGAAVGRAVPSLERAVGVLVLASGLHDVGSAVEPHGPQHPRHLRRVGADRRSAHVRGHELMDCSHGSVFSGLR